MFKLLLALLFIIYLNNRIFSQEIIQKRAGTSAIIAGHLEVERFDSIPDSVLPKAALLRLMFRHASVGTTIDNGLYCLQGTRTSPAICKTFPQYKYDRRNWVFQLRGNSGWYGKIADFMSESRIQLDSHDVFSFKYCYLDGLDELAEPCGKPYSQASVSKAWNALRDSMESFERQHPDKIVVWCTIPLTQPGMHCTDTLNRLIRDYVKTKGKVLFDIADIQCHDSNQNRLTNSNGWEMAYYAWCGEKPPGPSCHPNWTGSVMLAKAFWWMMARLSGWGDSVIQYSDNQSFISDIRISPNPVNDKLNINFTITSESCVSFEIFSLTGVRVKQLTEMKRLLPGVYFLTGDMNEVEKGTYILRIKTQNCELFFKVLKI